jgi:hypothetical protein
MSIIHNKLLSFLIFLSLCSCRHVGDYYSDIKNEDIENINVADPSGTLDVGFSANTVGNKLSAFLYIRKANSNSAIELDEISININEQADDKANKHLSLLDTTGYIYFSQIKDLPNLDRKLNAGNLLKFVYEFNKSDFHETNRLTVKVNARFLDDGKIKFIYKEFKMNKHERYRSKFIDD